MKSLKQKFTRWYNREYGRKGTLWEQRYSVTMIGPGWSTKVAAAFVDLNPVRAKLVKDSADYKFCGYGEAIANIDEKTNLAAKKILKVMQSVEDEEETKVPKTVKNALKQYSTILADDGVDGKKGKKFSKAQAMKIVAEGGELTLSQLLRCETRYFTAGFALGSEAYILYVTDILNKKGMMFEHRKSGPSKLKHHEDSELRSFRNLAKDVIC